MSLAGWRDKGDVHKRLAKLKLLTCVHDCAKAISIIIVVDFIIMVGSLLCCIDGFSSELYVVPKRLLRFLCHKIRESQRVDGEKSSEMA